jgi:hypothetical protein
MAFITPVTSTISPVISISMPLGIQGIGITYSQFLLSLGKYNYGAEYFYMSAQNYQQIGQPFYYTQFDSNGNQIATIMPFAVDPYQSQPSIYYESDPTLIIFTGLSSLTFLVYQNSTVYLKFFATIAYLGNELDDIQDNNFEAVEIAEGVTFFEDYCNYLIENN